MRLFERVVLSVRGVCGSGGAVLVAGVLGLLPAMSAVAQEEDAVQERVVVTGSIIQGFGNLVETSPVTSIGEVDFDTRGVLRIEDMVNTLPQAFGAQGANLANGATRTASVDLRGLGSNRTLVLTNGRRMPYGSPRSTAAADLNIIPSALIERVDILTGGASATYGSDAMAGVVNFVLKDEFEGVRLDASYSFYNHDNNNTEIQNLLRGYSENNPRQFRVPQGMVNDGANLDLNLIFGSQTDDGRASFIGFLGYRDTKQILQGDRDYAQCALGVAGDNFSCRGSSTNEVANLVRSNPYLGFGLSGSPGSARIDLTGGPGQETFALRDPNGGDTFNYNPYNHYQRPIQQYTAAFFGSYEIYDWAEGYFDFVYSDNRTNVQIAPSGVFGLGVSGGNGGINCNNPFLSDAQRTALCSAAGYVLPDRADGITDEARAAQVADYQALLARLNNATPEQPFIAPVFILRRNVEGGARNEDNAASTWLARTGVRGDIPGTQLLFDAHASASFGQVSAVYNNDLSISRIAKALYAVNTPVLGPDGTPTGENQVVCSVNADNDPANDDPACVPYDIWSAAGPSDAAVAYVVQPLNLSGDVAQFIINATVSGSLEEYGLKLPSARDAVAFGAGVEYRRDELDLRPDANFQAGDGAGQGGPTRALNGHTEVTEFFGEVTVPIVQETRMVHLLGVDAAFRFSNYSNSGSTSLSDSTYKVGAEYAPIEGVRFRGSYQRAARAPNIFELFTPQRIGLFDLTQGANGLYDPCAGETPARTREECARTGVTATQYGTITDNPAGQFNTQLSGSETLTQEIADTWTVGLVASPDQFVSGLTFSLDYFNIKISDYIGIIPQSVSLNRCLDSGQLCENVVRGNGGTLWASNSGYVIAFNVNTGFLETTGLDLLVNYSFDTDNWGSFNVDYVGTYVLSLVTDPSPGGTGTPAEVYDCVGYYGTTCGRSSPRYRHKLSLDWAPVQLPASVRLTWRYFDQVEAEQRSSDPFLSGSVSPANAVLDTQNYFDLSASYTLNEKMTFRLGVNNIFDVDPPLSSQVGTAPGNGNTYPQVYDSFGRYIFASAVVDL